MAKPYTVFYGTQVYAEYDKPQDIRQDISVSSDVYQGGYYYWRNAAEQSRRWYRMDGTPVLLEDVPKLLRMLVLVLNL